MENETLVALTADIVAAHVTNNPVSVGDVASVIGKVHQALTDLSAPPEEPAPESRRPAVSVRASVKRDYLVCLACGRKQKTLKRHLMTAHEMTPAQYRDAYGLRSDYPMVTQAYSEQRRAFAKSIGLGRKSRKLPAEGRAPAPTRRKAVRAAKTRGGRKGR